MDCLERVTAPRYVPTDGQRASLHSCAPSDFLILADDVLRARLKTLGVSEYRFQVKDGALSVLLEHSLTLLISLCMCRLRLFDARMARVRRRRASITSKCAFYLRCGHASLTYRSEVRLHRRLRRAWDARAEAGACSGVGAVLR